MGYHEEMAAEEKRKYQPYVSFFDHAVINKPLTEKSGRPRYTALTYIQKIPSAPDLGSRDVFSRKMVPVDKTDWPEQWALYLKRQEAGKSFDPPIKAVFWAMDIAQQHEITDLLIKTCGELVGHQGDLGELEYMRGIATQTLEMGNELRNRRQVREGRESVHNDADRLMHNSADIPGRSGFAGPIQTIQEESHQEKGDEEGFQTFNYKIQVA